MHESDLNSGNSENHWLACFDCLIVTDLDDESPELDLLEQHSACQGELYTSLKLDSVKSLFPEANVSKWRTGVRIFDGDEIQIIRRFWRL